METKVCKVCGKELPITEFRKTPICPNGVNTCNKCSARKRAENKERKEAFEGGVRAKVTQNSHDSHQESLLTN